MTIVRAVRRNRRPRLFVGGYRCPLRVIFIISCWLYAYETGCTRKNQTIQPISFVFHTILFTITRKKRREHSIRTQRNTYLFDYSVNTRVFVSGRQLLGIVKHSYVIRADSLRKNKTSLSPRLWTLPTRWRTFAWSARLWLPWRSPCPRPPFVRDP